MNKLKNKLRLLLIKISNIFKSSENLIEAKGKWNKLAKDNARYFVLTDKGEKISEEEFRGAGENDVDQYFVRDDLIAQMLDAREMTVLEIGCGIGRLSEFLSPLVNKLYAVDISEEMISKAKARLSNLNNIQFIATDGKSFPIQDQSIDVVFSFIVFQHMPSIEVIKENLREISRVLNPGGLAKIQFRGVPVSKDKWYYGPSFDRNDVDNLIKDLPLEIMRIEGEGQKYFWVWLNKIK